MSSSHPPAGRSSATRSRVACESTTWPPCAIAREARAPDDRWTLVVAGTAGLHLSGVQGDPNPERPGAVTPLALQLESASRGGAGARNAATKLSPSPCSTGMTPP